MPLSRSRRLTVLAILLAVASALASIPAVAAAQDVVGVPYTGVYQLTGGGWGHGHGLSQYGAQGAAYRGQTATQILDFYYTGTTSTAISSDTMRVRLAENYGAPLVVSAATGLVGTSSSGQQVTFPAGPSRWRLTTAVTGPAVTVDSMTGSTWTHYTTLNGSVTVSGPSLLTLWFGSATRVYDGTATTYPYYGVQNSNVNTAVESYVAGVVPYEMSGSFPAAALQAQAVAARSYGWYQRTSRRGQGLPYDVWDDTHDQVYRGPAGRTSSTDAATAATALRVRTYGGAVIFAQFGSSDGGWTASGGQPYLAARADPWEAYSSNPYRTWHASLSVSGICSWTGLTTLTGVRLVRETSAGGHVATVSFSGYRGSTATSVTETGDGMRSHYGLLSTYFGFDRLPVRAVADFTGDGRTDVSLWRPSTGTWYVHGLAGVAYGQNGDVPVPGSYAGGAAAQLAVWRPSDGSWSFRGYPTVRYGQAGDVPVPGDYDGDGRTDIGIFRASAHEWAFRGRPSISYGQAGDVPVPGDYNGDGRTEVALFRPSTGGWYIYGQPGVFYGQRGDVPVPGDYDGDGRTDIAIFRPSTGMWAFRGRASVFYGQRGDIPVPGDYDGRGVMIPAVWRGSVHQWFVRSHATTSYGLPGDAPLALPAAILTTAMQP